MIHERISRKYEESASGFPVFSPETAAPDSDQDASKAWLLINPDYPHWPLANSQAVLPRGDSYRIESL
jgi:hypothetical protein